MGYSFRRGIFPCVSSGYMILLDVTADRYFALDDRSQAAVARLTAGGAVPEDQDILSRLLSRGILVRSDRSNLSPAICVQPAIRDFRIVPSRATARQTWTALSIQIRARMILRQRGLEQGLEWAGPDAAVLEGDCPIDVDPLTLQIAAAARASALITASHDRCLPNSIALRRHLARSRCPSRLVLGVTARPFRAHAWVQSGDIVLNDTVDALRGFAPIYVL